MSIRQISVFLENRPGALNEMTGALTAAKIDMRALSLAEAADFGIARIIVDDVYAATNALKEAGFVSNRTPVLAYAVPDEPGGLHKLLGEFTAAGVSIEYMYAFLGGASSQHAYMIFRVADDKAVEAALAGKGLQPLTQEDVAKI